jgi:hypothetical protein
MYDQHVLAFVETIYGAHFDAIGYLHLMQFSVTTNVIRLCFVHWLCDRRPVSSAVSMAPQVTGSVICANTREATSPYRVISKKRVRFSRLAGYVVW